MLTERNGRIGNYYLPEAAAALGATPGFNVPGERAVLPARLRPAQIGLYVVPGTPVDTSQIHAAPDDSTLRGDRNNVAPRVGFAWQPTFAPKVVVRGGWGIYYERPSAGFKVDLQRAAPFFIYQNVPAPLDMADPYPQLNVNPFQIPLNVRIARDANGTPRWVNGDGTPFPATSPFSSKNNTFIDPLIETPSMQQWSTNVQCEASRHLLVDLRYVGSRGQDLLGKINLAVPLDPRVTPVNGFTDIYDPRGALINPDFFVRPSSSGSIATAASSSSPTSAGRPITRSSRICATASGPVRSSQVGYTFGKSLDTLSSDRSLVEHDPSRPENNYGRSDYDRPHRLSSAWVFSLPGVGERGLLAGLTRDWQIRPLHLAVGHAVHGARRVDDQRHLRAGRARANELCAWREHRDGRGFRVCPRIASTPISTWRRFAIPVMRGATPAGTFCADLRSGRSTSACRASCMCSTVSASSCGGTSSTRSMNRSSATPIRRSSPTDEYTAGRITSTIGGPRTMQLGVKYVF